ncbi:MAG: DUF3808 domain-containing protein [Candidatus Omnitrophica bacterium]|nr:DUF3808 domain-containing protein [Candidatus Omnitrophota bacterium]
MGEKFGNRVIVILLILCGIIAYVNTFGNQFIWDDTCLIVSNPIIKNWRWFPRIFLEDLYYRSSTSQFYRPFQTLSYLIDYSFWKLNPFGYHLTNMLFHIANSILLYFLTVILTKNRVVSLLTSLFFLLHPVQTQAVTYISGRADLLLLFFFLSSFILLLFYFSKKKRLCYLLSILSFVFALLSKELALIIPFFLLFYAYLFQKRRLFSLIPYFFIALIYIGLRSFWLAPYSSQEMVPCPFFVRLLTLPKIILSYLTLLIFPYHLHMERNVKLCRSLLGPSFLLPCFFLILVILGMVKLYKRAKMAPDLRLAFFGISSFFLLLFPNLNIIIPLNAVMAEHWLYLPSIGLFLGVSISLNRLSKLGTLRKPIILFLVLVFSLYSTRVISRNRDWKDEIKFYKSTLHYVPFSSRVHCQLGLAYKKKGENKKAFEEYWKAIRINPQSFSAYNNIGVLYRAKGNYEMAKKAFEKALEVNPEFIKGYYNLGLLFSIQENYGEAIKYFKKVLSLSPYYVNTYINLAVCYALKRPPELKLARKYVRLARNLGCKINVDFLKYLNELEAQIDRGE